MSAGQDYDRFWCLTPREIVLILDGYYERRRQDHEAARYRNYEMAALVGYAFHDPKAMPDYEVAGTARREVSTEIDDARVRAYFVGMSMREQ